MVGDSDKPTVGNYKRTPYPLRILVQLGFSCDGNFWQTDKQSSGLTFEQTDTQPSGSKFQQSNCQKVQFNPDLLDQRHRYLYRNGWRYLNQIK